MCFFTHFIYHQITWLFLNDLKFMKFTSIGYLVIYLQLSGIIKSRMLPYNPHNHPHS